MSRRAQAVIALVAVLAVIAPACNRGDERLTLTATFDDVLDLVPRAKVQTNNVAIGTVTGITLTDDNRAEVAMEVQSDTGLPSEVEAVLTQTSLLGERYVELVAVGDSGALASGEIDRTSATTDLEDLTDTGTDLLAFVAAENLSAALRAGAVTFGGRGGQLGNVLTQLEIFIGDYETGKDEITRLIDNLDSLIGTLASEAETNAGALEDLARSTEALAEEDDRLLDALEDLNRMAATGERILSEHRVEFEDFWRRLRILLDAITRVDGAFQNLLTWLPRHNLHVPNGIFLEHAQIWSDLVVCGTDDEERDEGDQTCLPENPGVTNTPRSDHEHNECDESHNDCPGGDPTTDNGPDEQQSEPDDGHDDIQDDGYEGGGGGG